MMRHHVTRDRRLWRGKASCVPWLKCRRSSLDRLHRRIGLALFEVGYGFGGMRNRVRYISRVATVDSLGSDAPNHVPPLVFAKAEDFYSTPRLSCPTRRVVPSCAAVTPSSCIGFLRRGAPRRPLFYTQTRVRLEIVKEFGMSLTPFFPPSSALSKKATSPLAVRLGGLRRFVRRRHP
jgi:hypothetical protein